MSTIYCPPEARCKRSACGERATRVMLIEMSGSRYVSKVCDDHATEIRAEIAREPRLLATIVSDKRIITREN